jgi:hypothetical protein
MLMTQRAGDETIGDSFGSVAMERLPQSERSQRDAAGQW